MIADSFHARRKLPTRKDNNSTETYIGLTENDFKTRGGGGVLPYKVLMGTCGQPGYVFRDFCLEQGIEFIIFCLNQGIDLSIFVLNWVKCLKQTGYQKSEFCLKMGRKISDISICLKQGQGMRGRAASTPPSPSPPGLGFKTRYRSHTASFRHAKHRNSTELSKHIWPSKTTTSNTLFPGAFSRRTRRTTALAKDVTSASKKNS